nr:uncharacterized protein LOC119170369 [Rhipicephalus microplus]UKD60441.1 calcitonin A splice variant [Rhipicephalus microplus]
MVTTTQCKFLAALALVLLCCAMVTTNADYTVDDIRQIVNRRKGLEIIREIVDDLHRQLTTLHKRSCHIDAGLNRGCDYKDIMDAVEENKFWKSRDSPGRRRRSIEDKATKAATSSQATQDAVVRSVQQAAN